MLVDPTLLCRALVGLADVEVVGVIGWTSPLQVHIASTLARPACSACGTPARVKQTLRRRLVDLPDLGLDHPGVRITDVVSQLQIVRDRAVLFFRFV